MGAEDPGRHLSLQVRSDYIAIPHLDPDTGMESANGPSRMERASGRGWLTWVLNVDILDVGLAR